ncbi:MAG TPA: hypothetical protein VHE13_10335 [Opitutus sp.]|nr:hypothetical protein [Opitutus sp.]
MSVISNHPFLTLPHLQRRTGPAWLCWNLRRLFRMLYVNLLLVFVRLLGAVSTPGMRPVGVLQAWALRRMGVHCHSSLVWIGPRFSLDFPEGLTLGRRVVIGADSRLTARSPITIGDDFLSAPGLIINTGTHDLNTLEPRTAPIMIGPGVWCGLRVTICTGVTIGAGAIVGAGAVVVKDLPPRTLGLGVPCHPQRALAPLPPGSPRWSNFPSD